jgi:hypothetical protein
VRCAVWPVWRIRDLTSVSRVLVSVECRVCGEIERRVVGGRGTWVDPFFLSDQRNYGHFDTCSLVQTDSSIQIAHS